MQRLAPSFLVLLAIVLAAGCDSPSGDGDVVGSGTDVQDPGNPPPDDGGPDVAADPGRDATLPPEDVTADRPGADATPGDDGPDAHPANAPYLLIVAQDDLATVAGEWAAYRRSGGFEVDVTTVTALAGDAPDGPAFQDAIRPRLSTEVASRGADARVFLLLLGDAPAEGGAESGRIPAQDCENTTSGASGCWTDNRYVDLDGDRVPEVPVGRVPARTEAEARAVLAKVQDFESTYRVGEWNRRVSLYIGQAGFSPEIDGVLETAMMDGLTRVSHAFDIVGAWDNPSSSYWYEPFNDKVVDLFNDGALMTVYVGHGSESWTQGLTTEQVGKIHCTNRRPFSLFFACYAGNYAASKDSLAETLAFKPDGPIASWGASDVSHPFGNAVLAYESQLKALDMRYGTIGEVILAIKRGLTENDDEFRQFLAGAGVLDPSCDSPAKQDEILRQHDDLYNLLGDPATSMQYPRDIAAFDAPSGTMASRHVDVSGTVPGIATGTAIVTFEVERNEIVGDLIPIDEDDPDAADVNANWQTSNRKAVVRQEVPVAGGRFEASLSWDGNPPGGDFYLKVYAQDGTTDAIGVVDFH